MLALIGYIVFALMIYLIVTEKAHVIFCFSVLPVVGVLIAGFTPQEISAFASTGISKIAGTAVMLIFAVIYFCIMNDGGMFDGMVNRLADTAGKNIVGVVIVTAIIAALGHLDGASASTALITIPCMMPIYKKLNMRLELLLFTVGLSMAFMNFMPWNGSTAKPAIALAIDATNLWRTYFPVQIASLVVILIVAVLNGIGEKKRISKLSLEANSDVVQESAAALDETQKVLTPKQKKLIPVNIILTIAILIILMAGWVKASLMFMLGTCLALIINYGDVKKQNGVIRKFAGMAIITGVACMAAGVMIGTVSESGMLTAMVKALVGILPVAISNHLQILMAAIAVPVAAATGMTGYYLGIMPFIVGVGQQFGIAPINMCLWMSIGEHFAMFLHPALPGVILGLGLTGVGYSRLLKFSFVKAWLVAAVVTIIAVIMGVAVV